MSASASALTASTRFASGCPSLRRIVSARDGGICRIRLTGGVLSVEHAKCIARASVRFGNGVVELTNRANVQLRGIAQENEAELIAILVQAGLGGESDQVDEASNLLLSPLAGICADARVDVRPLAQSVLQRLQQKHGVVVAAKIAGNDNETNKGRSYAAIAGLSPKFSVQLDGGESLAMLGHHHDIWFSALPDDTIKSETRTQGHWFAFGIAGSPPTIAHPHAILGAVHSTLLPDLASALVKSFLALRRDQETRMRHVVRRLGTMALLHQAVRLLTSSPTSPASPSSVTTGHSEIDHGHFAALNDRLMLPDEALLAWRRTPVDDALRFGAHEQIAKAAIPSAATVPRGSTPPPVASASLHYVGAQAPLGRLRAEALSALADLAQTCQQAEHGLRITPWQSVLLPNIARTDVAHAQAGLRSAGLLDSPSQPLGALVACTGNSGCAKAHTDSKADALALAARLQHPLAVHLSACERRCAAAHPMPFTLLALSSDLSNSSASSGSSALYDLYAADQRIAESVTIDQAATYFNAMPHATLQAFPNPLSPPSSATSSTALSADTSQTSHA